MLIVILVGVVVVVVVMVFLLLLSRSLTEATMGYPIDCRECWYMSGYATEVEIALSAVKVSCDGHHDESRRSNSFRNNSGGGGC